MRLHLTATLALCALFVFLEGENAAFGKKSGANPQDGSNLPNASAVVKPRSYVSLEPVPRGSQFQVAVVVDIARGFHMNSHKPSDAYLIPTTLTPQLPAGIRLDDAVYPEGRSEKFSFSPDKPLNVYTGTVTLRLRLSASATAALGTTPLPLTLRYQACNDAACLPPVKVPVALSLQIAPVSAKAHAVHPEVFSASSASK